MARKKDNTEKFEKFVKDYLVFEKEAKGVYGIEPPEKMVKAMASDMKENEKLFEFAVERVNAIYTKLEDFEKTEELQAKYDEVQADIKDLK